MLRRIAWKADLGTTSFPAIIFPNEIFDIFIIHHINSLTCVCSINPCTSPESYPKALTRSRQANPGQNFALTDFCIIPLILGGLAR